MSLFSLLSRSNLYCFFFISNDRTNHNMLHKLVSNERCFEERFDELAEGHRSKTTWLCFLNVCAKRQCQCTQGCTVQLFILKIII